MHVTDQVDHFNSIESQAQLLSVLNISKCPSETNEKTKNKKKLHSVKDFSSLLSLHPGQASETELVVSLEKAISRLCFSEGVSTDEEEVTTIYEILNRRRGVKYKMLKNVILDQLLVAISTSKEERFITASVSY
ncbi:hypothetical protein LINPERHAP2_LOCUS19265 [Linum perenne]